MGDVLIDVAVHGSILALLAVGLTLVHGTLGFPNVAHVELATIAAYLTVAMLGAGFVLWSGALIGVVGTALIAVALYRLVFRRLLASGPMIAMIGSLALSIVVRALIQLRFSSRPRQLPVPLERGIEFAGGLITPSQIRLVVISVCLLTATVLLLRFTALGRYVRAVAANAELAEVSGLRPGRIVDVMWVLSAVLAGAAGVLLAIDSAASPDLGFTLLLPVFAAAIVGGLGSVAGAIAAAYGLALAEALVLQVDFGAVISGLGYLDVSYRPVVGFLLLVLTLTLRPQGLMGREVRRG
jgi:branched-subunit amino acid ABC-type transport system permease component